jgi:hypothetical protein
MARRCTICVRGDRTRIDAALLSGSEVKETARAYSVSSFALLRHRSAGHVLGIAAAPKPKPVVPGLNPAEVERLRPPATRAAEPQPAPASIEPVSVSLRSPSDVLGALESVVSESLALLERSKATGDLRMQNSLLNTLVATLDKLAKSVGLYQDGTVVNVNTTNQRLELAVSKLSDDQLLALLGGVSA